MLEDMFGWKIGASYPAITSIIFLLVLFYGADFAYRRINKLLGRGDLAREVGNLTKELSARSGIPEDQIKAALDDQFGKGRNKGFVHACLSVFRPSKERGNAPMIVANRRIEPRLIAEVPGDAQMLDFDEAHGNQAHPPSP